MLAASQGFAGRELKGQQGAERPPYSKPKTMWETPRNPSTNSGEGLGDPKRARVTVSRRRGSSWQATMHLCSLNGNKTRVFGGGGEMSTQARPLLET